VTLKKITVCVIVDEKEEVEIVERWIEKWKLKFRHIKSKGCCCCVISYDVLVPSSAVGE
jgi:G3E family GTPase